MIPADGSQYVYYEKSNNTLPRRKVIAWGDNGEPLVVGRRGLVPAWELGSIDRLASEDAPVVGAVSGGGWLIDCKDDEGNEWTLPILAWTIHANGSTTPLTTDRDGVTGDATEGLDSYRIYHHAERLPADSDA
ncbi:hypothetical protein ABK046_42825 [Streptomyces caeruleatus]